MPGPHHVVLASGAVVAVSMAVATAIAIYESPELRRYADDVRRRIAMAFYSVGDGIIPPHREPLFNRPEDSEGFMETSRGAGAEPGVDADDETRRRQREELLYWNSLRLQKMEENQEKEPETTKAIETRPRAVTRGSSFDDFLRPDTTEQGAFIFNSGSDVRAENENLRRRGEGARGFMTPMAANPFADEHHLDHDEVEHLATSSITPGKDEAMSDLYSATTRDEDEARRIMPGSLESLNAEPAPSHTESSGTLERELSHDELVTAGQDDHNEAYASIQAWAQKSTPDFYSPLPVTPSVAMSEPELISEGELTPTDSVSLAGSGEDVADDDMSRDGDEARPFDVMSESEGIATPASWSEIGSVISDNDAPLHA